MLLRMKEQHIHINTNMQLNNVTLEHFCSFKRELNTITFTVFFTIKA